MASVFPNTSVPGHLKDLLERAKTLGIPPRVNKEWLTSVGFASSSDPSMIRPLAFVGLIDGDGTPTRLWGAIRGGGSEKRELGAAIRSAYADLFAVYPDAHQRDTEALINFFRSKLSGGQLMQQRTVSTFQVLCSFAEFDGAAAEPEPRTPSRKKKDEGQTVTVEEPASGVVVNVNIQLQLPPSTDAAVYDEFFKALRRHLLKS